MLQCIHIGHPAASAGAMDAPSGKGGIVCGCEGDCPDSWGPGQIINYPRMFELIQLGCRPKAGILQPNGRERASAMSVDRSGAPQGVGRGLIIQDLGMGRTIPRAVAKARKTASGARLVWSLGYPVSFAD